MKTQKNLTIDQVASKLSIIQGGKGLEPVDTFKMPIVSINLSRDYT
jgi:hypothetical protein